MGECRTIIRCFKKLVLFPLLVIILEILIIIKRCCFGVVALIIPRVEQKVVRTPEERFQGLESFGYVFKPNYANLTIGGGVTLPRLHYVDEGPRDARETILCLHGEPSWSFLYRKMIPSFVNAGYRVIAPDFIGFGKSDKYTNTESYTHDMHTMTLRLLLDYLQVKNLTLVCQDWGGLIGLTVVKDCSHLFSRLVIMNTGLPKGISIKNIERSTPFMLFRGFVQLLGTSMPINYIFSNALKNTDSKDVAWGYAAPFPSPLYKAGAARWPLLVPISPYSATAAEMQLTREFLKNNWTYPALIMFSDRDPITKGQDKAFKHLIPHAIVVPVANAGHFLQEDKGEELATNIIHFMSGN